MNKYGKFDEKGSEYIITLDGKMVTTAVIPRVGDEMEHIVEVYM